LYGLFESFNHAVQLRSGQSIVRFGAFKALYAQLVCQYIPSDGQLLQYTLKVDVLNDVLPILRRLGRTTQNSNFLDQLLLFGLPYKTERAECLSAI
jgi:hypothetical protein